ncbi:MAG: V-type ATP synthase subunit F [Acholeplasmataceae bacterium]
MIYAIGPTDSVLLFQSIGIKALIIEEEKELKKTIDALSSDAKIIFVSESLKAYMSDISKKYEHLAYPIIVLIPMDGKDSDLGLEKLKKDVERAIGMALI